MSARHGVPMAILGALLVAQLGCGSDGRAGGGAGSAPAALEDRDAACRPAPDPSLIRLDERQLADLRQACTEGEGCFALITRTLAKLKVQPTRATVLAVWERVSEEEAR